MSERQGDATRDIDAPDSEPGTEPGTEPEGTTEVEVGTEPAPEAEGAVEPAPEVEGAVEPAPEAATEPESGPEAESDSDSDSEPEPEPEPVPEPEAEPEPEPAGESEPEPVPVQADEVEPESVDAEEAPGDEDPGPVVPEPEPTAAAASELDVAETTTAEEQATEPAVSPEEPEPEPEPEPAAPTAEVPAGPVMPPETLAAAALVAERLSFGLGGLTPEGPVVDELPATEGPASETADEAVEPEVPAAAPPRRSIWAAPDEDELAPLPAPAERSIWAPPTDVVGGAEPTAAAASGAAVTAAAAATQTQELSGAGGSAPVAVPVEAPAAVPAVEHFGEPVIETIVVPDVDGDDAPHPRRRRRWVIAGVIAAVVVVLGGLYVGALWLWADRVPPGTTVAGVDIGGLQADSAVAALTDGLSTAATGDLSVAVSGTTTAIDPADAGLTFDAQATVDSVTGFGLEPARLWHQLFGGASVQPMSTVDRAALSDAIDAVTEALSTPYVDGTLAFVDGEPTVTAPEDGVTLDVPASVDVVAAGWLTKARPIELPTKVDPAVIGQEELDNAVTQLARPLAEAPVKVAVGGQVAELPADVLTDAASFVSEGDALVLQMDGQKLVDAVLARTTNLLTPASDASFAFVDDHPTIVAGVPGTTIAPADIAAAVATAATASADRTAQVQLVETDPAESTAALEALGITAVVSEFSTPLTSEPRRTRNIANGAAHLNGMLIRPGEEFNLGDALGPLTAANGYEQAGAIVNGEHTDAWGGGLSQMSTTTYNAAFFAGYELVEHHPHSEWFSRYPEGRESTIFTPEINMRWVNNTPYGALLQSWVADGHVYVRIWSTPYYTVETTTSGRSNVRSPTTVYSQSPTCEAQGSGNPGFTVTVTRRVLLGGAEQSSESWTVSYKPQNKIVCGAPPA